MKLRIPVFLTFFVATGLLVLIGIGNLPFAAGQDEAECGAEVEGFKLCIKTEKSRFAVGDDITVVITLQNLTDIDKQIITSSKEHKFEINCVSEATVECPDLRIASVFENFVSARQQVLIRAKDILQKKEVISSEYNFSQPGTYDLSLSRRVPSSSSETGFVDITSNKIVIEVNDR